MRRLMVGLALAALSLAACAPSTNNNAGGSPSATGSTLDCSKSSLHLVTAGQLTIGTDNPAYPPWYAGGDTQGTEWKINNPATGKGYESAVAYAVAGQLGFSTSEVKWIVVPFNQSFKPGPKPFDFDINQISYKPVRAGAVDFSDSYYDVSQAVIAIRGSALAKVTSVSQLKDFTLATQIGTTSYDVGQAAGAKMAAYNTLNDAIQALKSHQVDGLIEDLPDAFYTTAVQIPHSVIVGQFPQTGAVKEHFGMVFQKGDPLVACVNKALATLKSNGALAQIAQTWLATKAHAPVLSP